VVIAEVGAFKMRTKKIVHPAWARHSVHMRGKLAGADFRLRAPAKTRRVLANVIGVIENQAPTRHLILELPVEDGAVKVDSVQDLAKLAVIRRHDGTGGTRIGLVSGFGFTARCAVASTVAHDCHHMLVVGTDDEDMAIAANVLAQIGGGQVVVKDGRVIGQVELRIGGLMADEPVDVVARKAEAVLAGFRACGCQINNPNMQLSLLALPVIPELRLSDKGLVDVTKFAFIPVLEKAK